MIHVVVRPEPALRIGKPVRALTRAEIPRRLSDRALLGDDLDHAVRRFGSVERRRGRTLHDLDALDVVGIEVVPARRRRGAEALVLHAGRLRVVDAYAVDVDERLIREREARDAANADRRAGATTPEFASSVTPGVRPLSSDCTLLIGAFCTSVVASICATSTPSARRWVLPGVPVTTTSFSETAAWASLMSDVLVADVHLHRRGRVADAASDQGDRSADRIGHARQVKATVRIRGRGQPGARDRDLRGNDGCAVASGSPK